LDSRGQNVGIVQTSPHRVDLSPPQSVCRCHGPREPDNLMALS
jgi:hypothetical protein